MKCIEGVSHEGKTPCRIAKHKDCFTSQIELGRVNVNMFHKSQFAVKEESKVPPILLGFNRSISCERGNVQINRWVKAFLVRKKWKISVLSCSIARPSLVRKSIIKR